MTLSTKKKSARQENRLAQRYGGSVTPGSGNGWIKKNDVRSADLSIEAKYTDKKQFTLKQADLHTAEQHALLDGRDSVLIISFSGEEWAVIREADYRASREVTYPFTDGDALILGPETFAANYEDDDDTIRIAYKGGWFMPIPQADAPHADPNQPMLPGAERW